MKVKKTKHISIKFKGHFLCNTKYKFIHYLSGVYTPILCSKELQFEMENIDRFKSFSNEKISRQV